eukprot:Filipodium_phascolosomae@DN4804_c0_g1_i1.p1
MFDEYLKKEPSGSFNSRITDGYIYRTMVVATLARFIRVHSFGKCLNNSEWPLDDDISNLANATTTTTTSTREGAGGRAGNKMQVLRRYRYCLAIENSPSEPWYHTEKLWDCLESGAITLYLGNRPTATDILPSANSTLQSVIFIEDFLPRLDSLAKYLDHLPTNTTAMRMLNDWKKSPPDEWVGRMSHIESASILCRLCRFAATE